MLIAVLVVTGEILRESVAKSHVHSTLNLPLAQERVDGSSDIVPATTFSMLPVSRSMTTS